MLNSVPIAQAVGWLPFEDIRRTDHGKVRVELDDSFSKLEQVALGMFFRIENRRPRHAKVARRLRPVLARAFTGLFRECRETRRVELFTISHSIELTKRNLKGYVFLAIVAETTTLKAK